jgi:peptide/nickel transport system substrate-binding protein
MARHWRRGWRVRQCVAPTAALALAGLLAACATGTGSGSGSSNASGPSGTVPAYVSTSPFTADFNPLSAGATSLTLGTVYEPLMFFDTAQAGNVHPWLATGYTWGNGGKSITFALRHGVTWSDGKPFTSADVAFTFNFIKNPALNQFGLPIVSAVANGPYSVTVSFSRPVYTDLDNFAGHIYMLPQHVWSTVKKPATWLNPHPVGTGAYMVAKVTPQLLSLTARPHYYMPGMPKVKTYNFEYFSGNQTVDTAIENGQLGWAAAFVPNVKRLYVAKNPRNALTDIPLALGVLIPNMVKGPTTSLAVRQAVSVALDRSYIDQAIYSGYNGRANPEAVLMPNFRSIASQPSLTDSFGPANPARARQILESAGYKLGSNGIFNTPQGQPLTLNVQYPTGWTDGDDILQIAAQELKAAGINLTITLPSPSVYFSNLYSGNFQLIEASYGDTPIPYTFYRGMLSSAITKPVGTAESIGNFGRYHNPTVDHLLNMIGAITNTQQQKPAFAQIEAIVKAQLPVIPVFNAEDEIEFNGNMVTGYPTASNPYAGTPAWLAPDNGWVAARLAPAK